MLKSSLLAILSLLLCVAAAPAQQLVAPTGPLTPAEQQKKFKLPPGFEIQLVANEPQVHKPMNLKFDAQGRLWLTHSLEYPFAAKDNEKARDAISIFSEFSPEGKAGKVERFAEKLNIPIGVLPWKTNEAIAWSIPNLFRFTDTNNDGVADQQTVAFGPFGFNDTHGNQNALTRWLDGWVYACHGFSNHSKVKIGGEGDVVLEMQSGNTYRFRPDGSAIEQNSWGQVNPFGLCFDPIGNMFTADCHSRPVTLVLRGGYYQSFGKPHDGLGYAPELTDKDHGGTGIAGMVYYAAEAFPAEFRDVLFVGNVITNKIHCDRLKWNGSSAYVEKVEDFLTCDDPWFRPVDIQLGPDGALYVADFYNKIIGHYEVPLTHPERDRDRGRLWRIVYTGKEGEKKQTPAKLPNFAAASAKELVAQLGDANINVRVFATHELVDRFSKEAPGELKTVFSGESKPEQRAHALWVMFRTTGLDEALAKQLAGDKDRLVRAHLAQALGETTKWDAWQFEVVRKLTSDDDRTVRRSAAVALSKHPAAENISPLVTLLRATPPEDPQLIHATRIALRDQLRSDQVAASLSKIKFTPEQRESILPIAAVVPNGPAALLIYEAALEGQVNETQLAAAIPAAIKYIDAPRVDALIDFITKRYEKDTNYQLQLLRGMSDGLATRGIEPSAKMRETLTKLLRPAITGEVVAGWSNHPVPGAKPSPSPWAPEKREYQDGQNQEQMISSIHGRNPEGERMTGILRSPDFQLPAKLSFWMCGHNGPPGSEGEPKNYIRAVLADGTEVAKSVPPRSDIAQRFEWDLTKFAGQTGYIEVVDNIVSDGYAWLAVSRFEPAVIRVPSAPVGDAGASQSAALRMAGELRLSGLSKDVAAVTREPKTPSSIRLAGCEALVTLSSQEAVEPLASLLADSQQATLLRQQAAELLGRIDSAAARTALLAQLRLAPQPVAVVIGTALAGRPESAALLLADIRGGKASASLLKEPTVLARLKTAKIDKLDEQVAELTAKLAPQDDRIAQLIKSRRETFLAGKFSEETGKAVFAKTACAKCHKIGTTGATLAPALDGIGVRGLDRLLEDVLDPNRNVDQAFRMHIIATSGGQIVSGFGVREEGKTLVLTDSEGKPQRVPLDDVEERTISSLSPMPANLVDQISPDDFYHLLAYLLSQRVKE